MPKESPGEIEFNAGEFSCRLGWSGRGIRRFHFRKRGMAANPLKRGSGCGLGVRAKINFQFEEIFYHLRQQHFLGVEAPVRQGAGSPSRRRRSSSTPTNGGVQQRSRTGWIGNKAGSPRKQEIESIELAFVGCKQKWEVIFARALGPAFVREALSKLEDYFNCMKVDFISIPLDLSGLGEFSQRVYLAAGKIPYGETVSYLDLAERAGSPMASRAVGACMKKNPLPVFIPCHRVIRKDGRPGGFTSPDGPEMKVKLLLMEGVNL